MGNCTGTCTTCKCFLERKDALKFDVLHHDRHWFSCYMYKACKDGFFGDNWFTNCPAMFFGPGCLSQCNCTKYQCLHLTVCL